MDTSIKLTSFSHGAGCGCKISPQILDQILHTDTPKKNHPLLLVGNESRDDAAVFDWQNGEAVISTTDFFMPIVDDAYDFGRIAAANAISDVYAMGGTPLFALALVGMPVNTQSMAMNITATANTATRRPIRRMRRGAGSPGRGAKCMGRSDRSGMLQYVRADCSFAGVAPGRPDCPPFHPTTWRSTSN